MTGFTAQTRTNSLSRLWPVGIFAGASGGAIEIAWIAFYQSLTGHDGATIARGVTQSTISELAAAPSAVLIGLAIHMVLSLALGLAICIMMRHVLRAYVSAVLEPVAVVSVLVGVWAVNFFVILPVINPEFVTLVPYGVSLVSKVLFGFAAALALRLSSR